MKSLKTLMIASGLLFLLGCSKEKKLSADPAKPTPYFVRMTDAPGPYTAVFIDLQGVVVTGNSGADVNLATTPGIYNLLDFSNGVDTLIATGSLNTDRVQQIRLILGNNNSLVVAGDTVPLTIPSSAQSGLKLKVHQDLEPGVAYEVLLDFDANQSVVDHGNNTYSLKPVIRTIQTAISGSIKGRVSVAGVPVTVTATSGGVSYSSVVDANGDFLIAGLPAGTYSLTVTPQSPYNPNSINSINVTVGANTNVGVINI